MKDGIIGVILKVSFGNKSGVFPESYLVELKNDSAWHTPSRYKYLDGHGQKLLLYDPERKAITAEVVIKRVKKLKGNFDYPWRNEFVPRSVKILPKPISVSAIQAIPGFKNFGVHRKDRVSHRNVTGEQYLALHSGHAAPLIGVMAEQEAAEAEGEFSPGSEKEAKKRVYRSIVLRRGQARFRKRLLAAYDRRCCVTGTASEDVLEAAHIEPYATSSTNSLKNGLLLRSDVHVLFDLFLLSIHPITRRIYCCSSIRGFPPYDVLHKKKAIFPAIESAAPDIQRLRKHYRRSTA
jgi:hypothetical protein